VYKRESSHFICISDNNLAISSKIKVTELQRPPVVFSNSILMIITVSEDKLII
jgi:hypothetical protein